MMMASAAISIMHMMAAGDAVHSRTSYSNATPSGSFSSNHFYAASTFANTLTWSASPTCLLVLIQTKTVTDPSLAFAYSGGSFRNRLGKLGVERGSGRRGARIMLRVVQAMLCALVILPVFSPAFGLTLQELVAKLESAGYSQIREIRSGKITTYKAVKSGKEVSLVVDSFGKFKELP